MTDYDVYHKGNLGLVTWEIDGIMSKEDKKKLDEMTGTDIQVITRAATLADLPLLTEKQLGYVVDINSFYVLKDGVNFRVTEELNYDNIFVRVKEYLDTVYNQYFNSVLEGKMSDWLALNRVKSIDFFNNGLVMEFQNGSIRSYTYMVDELGQIYRILDEQHETDITVNWHNTER